MQVVYPARQRKLLGVGLDGFVIQTRPIHAEQLALTAHRQPGVGFHQRPTGRHRNRPSLVTKNPSPPAALRSSAAVQPRVLTNRPGALFGFERTLDILQQLTLPLADLIRVNLVPPRELRNRLLLS
jgi:hypothetical protein